jgi:hypothetical protein
MTPGPLRDMMAPEEDAARRADAAASEEKARRARVEAAAAKEAARQQRAQEVEEKKRRNGVAEADYQTHGVEHYTDDFGYIQPVKEVDGQPRLRDRAGKT